VVVGLGNALKVAATAIGGVRLAVTLLSAHPLVALGTALSAVALSAAHFSGLLDPLYRQLGKITSASVDASGGVDKLRDSFKGAADAAQQLSIDEKILAKQKEIREFAGFRKLLPKLKEELAALEASRDAFAKGQAEKLSGPEKLRSEARTRLNNLIGLLPGKLQAAITGKELPPSVQEAFTKLGELLGELSNSMADAVGAVNQIELPAVGLDVVRQSTSATALFDTRLAQQAFGGASDVQNQQLTVQKQIRDAVRQRGGLPVV
jgi:hypothetical protein